MLPNNFQLPQQANMQAQNRLPALPQNSPMTRPIAGNSAGVQGWLSGRPQPGGADFHTQMQDWQGMRPQMGHQMGFQPQMPQQMGQMGQPQMQPQQMGFQPQMMPPQMGYSAMSQQAGSPMTMVAPQGQAALSGQNFFGRRMGA